MNQVPQIESRMGRLVISDNSASALPLQKTVIQGQVIGPLVSVLVTQQFANPLADPAELDYLFPLPSRAAIVDFELHIGSRTIQADIQELEQARQAYEEASQNG
ncbi:MAG TPA: VIT domain-containing protein, partial [Anaerolineaceae bacterium]